MKMDKAELGQNLLELMLQRFTFKITVSRKNGELSAQATDKALFPLTFKEETTFVLQQPELKWYLEINHSF